MTVKYIVLLKAVTLETTSVIRVTENAAASNLTVIDPATGVALASSKQFFARGDGGTDDLLRVYDETVTSHAGTNTYTTSLSLSIDPAAVAGTVTLTRATGTNNFQVNWSHASTTFDEATLGYANSDTANDGNPKVSTLSPSSIWVAPDVREFFEPVEEYAATVTRARSGKVRGVKRGGPYDVRRLSHKFIDSRRVWDWDNTADPTAAFNSFLSATADGTRFEVHEVALSSGTTLGALSTSTRIGTAWHWDEDTVQAFEPTRMEPGLSLYEFQLRLLGYVA